MSNVTNITTIKHFKEFAKTTKNFVVYLYSPQIITCKQILEEKKIFELFEYENENTDDDENENKDKQLQLVMIDAIKHTPLVTFLKVNYYPIFLIFKDGCEIEQINGNYEDALDILKNQMHNKLLHQEIQIINYDLMNSQSNINDI